MNGREVIQATFNVKKPDKEEIRLKCLGLATERSKVNIIDVIKNPTVEYTVDFNSKNDYADDVKVKKPFFKTLKEKIVQKHRENVASKPAWRSKMSWAMSFAVCAAIIVAVPFVAYQIVNKDNGGVRQPQDPGSIVQTMIEAGTSKTTTSSTTTTVTTAPPETTAPITTPTAPATTEITAETTPGETTKKPSTTTPVKTPAGNYKLPEEALEYAVPIEEAYKSIDEYAKLGYYANGNIMTRTDFDYLCSRGENLNYDDVSPFGLKEKYGQSAVFWWVQGTGYLALYRGKDIDGSEGIGMKFLKPYSTRTIDPRFDNLEAYLAEKVICSDWKPQYNIHDLGLEIPADAVTSPDGKYAAFTVTEEFYFFGGLGIPVYPETIIAVAKLEGNNKGTVKNLYTFQGGVDTILEIGDILWSPNSRHVAVPYKFTRNGHISENFAIVTANNEFSDRINSYGDTYGGTDFDIVHTISNQLGISYAEPIEFTNFNMLGYINSYNYFYLKITPKEWIPDNLNTSYPNLRMECSFEITDDQGEIHTGTIVLNFPKNGSYEIISVTEN
jgi:hypothetical protein